MLAACAPAPRPASPRKRTWRSWLTLSGPMVRLPRCFWYQATLAAEPAKNVTPAPAKVIFEVEREDERPVRVPGLGRERQDVERRRARPRTGRARRTRCPRRCGSPAAAVGMEPARGSPPRCTRPRSGCAYVGTIQMPLIDGSLATRLATASMSGPSSASGDRDHLDAEAARRWRSAGRSPGPGRGTSTRPLDPGRRRVRCPCSSAARPCRASSQARVVAGDQLVDRDVEQLGEDLPHLGQAVASRRSCGSRCRRPP